MEYWLEVLLDEDALGRADSDRHSCGHAEAKPEERPAVLLLLLARTCIFMHSTALPHVMETLAATFPGQGGSSGSGQPPAFVAGQVGK